MPAHFVVVVVCLSVALAICLGVIAALIVMLRRCTSALHRTESLFRKCRGFHVRRMRGVRSALQRTESVFRKYREFHVRRIRGVRTAESTLLLELADAKETLKTCRQERSYFLAQWKIFEPKTAELSVLCPYWEAETHYWRKKCWWLSDKVARERDRDVVRAAVDTAVQEYAGIAFSD